MAQMGRPANLRSGTATAASHGGRRSVIAYSSSISDFATLVAWSTDVETPAEEVTKRLR